MQKLRLGALAAAVAAAVTADSAAAQLPRAEGRVIARYGARTPSGPRRGRPRKFSRPSRSVTLTLPEDVIAALQAIDADVSRAVVRAVQPLVADPPRPLAEVSTFGDRAVIVVPPSRVLRDRLGVELVPLSDGRALLAFDERLSAADIELRLRDAIAEGTLAPDDRALFEALVDILRSARRAEGMTLRQRSILVLHWTRVAATDAADEPGPRAVPA
jgi:hypothetical protein